MPTGRKSKDMGGSVSKNDLLKRLEQIEQERAKMTEEEKHIQNQLKQMDFEAIRGQIDFDKVILFKSKGADTYGKVSGMFKDAVQVNLCSMTGEPMEKPEGAKRFRLVATVEYSEIMKIL